MPHGVRHCYDVAEPGEKTLLLIFDGRRMIRKRPVAFSISIGWKKFRWPERTCVTFVPASFS
jgi:hypothetical protein